MLKVLHITTDFIPGTGGLERFVRDLAVHSRSAGLSPSLLALNRIAGDSQALPAQDLVDGLEVHRIPFLDLKYYKPALLPMSLLRQADLLHVHGIGALLDFTVATRFLHDRPIVASTHGGIFHTTKLGNIKNFYFALDRLLVLNRVDRLVACGESDRQLFASHGLPNLQVIDNGIDLAPFSADTVDTQRVANRLLFVGRISPNKSIDQLIRTLAILRQRDIPATLRVVGPDRYQLTTELKALAKQLSIEQAVTFTGDVSDVQLVEEYQSADLFVSASRHEGFGISAVEAMASGTVPVLSDIPAFRVLLTAPINSIAPGQLVNFADPAAAATTLANSLMTDRSALRAACRSQAGDFSWKQVIPRWIGLYEDVVSSQQSQLA